MSIQDIVVVEDLRKTYGKDIVAVDGISFRVHDGEIFARAKEGVLKGRFGASAKPALMSSNLQEVRKL